MEDLWDVIVVGGGLAGLAAGATATARGARTLVLEAGPRAAAPVRVPIMALSSTREPMRSISTGRAGGS
jgi:flavin-dependent dehydrogenase